jgi:hypothetical protein
LDESDRAGWFVGDLTDPWVAAIADALPDAVARVQCAGDLSEARLAERLAARTLVLHRAFLTPQDADCLTRLRSNLVPAPRVVLCVGPHIRSVDLERWSPLYDVLVPEATARDTVWRHVQGHEGRRTMPGLRPKVSVVSTNFELRHTLCEACQTAGYAATPAADWSKASSGGMAIWDIPVLDPSWPRTLAQRTRTSVILGLLGFPDRATVSEARAAGASACLELPCDLDDLVCVLDRLATARGEPPHDVPPPPASLRRPNRPIAISNPDE